MSAIAFVFGLCIGSFLNVCIYRMPRGRSLVRPGSRCPKCRKAIAPYDNIPVLSWIFLAGRCRKCRARISARYPLVELLTGAILGGLFWRWQGQWIWFGAVAAAAAALIALSFIDFDTFFIPDALSLGLVGLGVAAAPFNPWFSGQALAKLGASLMGGGLGLGAAWGLAVAGEWAFKKEALGGGDIKLLAGIGALVGWEGALSSLMIASLVGSVYGLGLMAAGRIRRRDAIPFGPFLALGAVINLFYRIGPVDLFF